MPADPQSLATGRNATRDGRIGAGMSLEMIIKFVLLLVVAAVIVAMIMNVFDGEDPVGGVDEIQNEQEIQTQCQQICDRWKRQDDAVSTAVEYCIQRFTYDADGDGQVQGQTAGSGYNTYCQDGVRCFNLHECTKDFQTLDAETCQDLMCQHYAESGVGAGDAASRIEETFAAGTADDNLGAGTCGIDSVTDATGQDIQTWWDQNFASVDCS